MQSRRPFHCAFSFFSASFTLPSEFVVYTPGYKLIPPDGIEQRVDASLEGVQSPREDRVHLDSEGGARATSPKTRYLSKCPPPVVAK
jgi:hypothetical protein